MCVHQMAQCSLNPGVLFQVILHTISTWGHFCYISEFKIRQETWLSPLQTFHLSRQIEKEKEADSYTNSFKISDIFFLPGSRVFIPPQSSRVNSNQNSSLTQNQNDVLDSLFTSHCSNWSPWTYHMFLSREASGLVASHFLYVATSSMAHHQPPRKQMGILGKATSYEKIYSPIQGCLGCPSVLSPSRMGLTQNKGQYCMGLWCHTGSYTSALFCLWCVCTYLSELSCQKEMGLHCWCPWGPCG